MAEIQKTAMRHGTDVVVCKGCEYDYPVRNGYHLNTLGGRFGQCADLVYREKMAKIVEKARIRELTQFILENTEEFRIGEEAARAIAELFTMNKFTYVAIGNLLEDRVLRNMKLKFDLPKNQQ